jgi:hypothetical protein
MEKDAFPYYDEDEEDEDMDDEIELIVAARAERGRVHKKGCSGMIIVGKFSSNEFMLARKEAEEYCRKHNVPCFVYSKVGEAKPQVPPVAWTTYNFSHGA